MSQTCGDQPLELLLRYRNRLTGKWINGALYVAKRHGIAARYADWEIIGPPGIREVDPSFHTLYSVGLVTLAGFIEPFIYFDM